jgi:hypothetical protein
MSFGIILKSIIRWFEEICSMGTIYLQISYIKFLHIQNIHYLV